MPKVSVIIPCYNQVEFLEEAIASVKNQTFKDYEIIIINDGSTEFNAIELINTFEGNNVIILHEVKFQQVYIKWNKTHIISKFILVK
mgnify:CR=1 FL=1